MSDHPKIEFPQSIPTLLEMYKERNGIKQDAPVIPNLTDLAKNLQQPQSLLGMAGETYCVAAHPDLYSKSFVAGAGAGIGAVVLVVGIVSVIGWVGRKLRVGL